MTVNISTDSELRGDQQKRITGLVFERGNSSLVKFAAVTSIPGVGPVGALLGFPKELKSTACAKLGGLLTEPSYWALISTPESRRYGRISCT